MVLQGNEHLGVVPRVFRQGLPGNFPADSVGRSREFIPMVDDDSVVQYGDGRFFRQQTCFVPAWRLEGQVIRLPLPRRQAGIDQRRGLTIDGPGLTIKPESAKVITDWKYVPGDGKNVEMDLSDHYPVMVTFSLWPGPKPITLAAPRN